jgi:hypothetical protein
MTERLAPLWSGDGPDARCGDEAKDGRAIVEARQPVLWVIEELALGRWTPIVYRHTRREGRCGLHDCRWDNPSGSYRLCRYVRSQP